MKEYGIETVDLLNATGHQLSGLIVPQMDRYYNDEGNRLIAVALGNHLKNVSDRPQQL